MIVLRGCEFDRSGWDVGCGYSCVSTKQEKVREEFSVQSSGESSSNSV
ncbi:hypothetical protein [Bacillus taeanensis]|nr:hypothetical protein [Bacillus taeanensis]